MSKTKAIIMDLDGTAVDSPGKQLPSDRLIKAMADLSDDFYICVATGRPWPMAEEIIESLGVSNPCIVSGGTQVYDPLTSSYLSQQNIGQESVERIYKILLNYDNNVVINDFSYDDYASGGYDKEAINQKEDLFFINMVNMQKETAENLRAQLSEISDINVSFGTSHRRGLLDLHITDKMATKEHAVASLLKTLGISRKNAIGIGDGHNDIHLFNAVGHKVAMGNAVPELKAVADEVIGDVKDDGLAAYFEKLAKKL